MKRLSDNYYHRKCYFEREQVPTQTVMKDIMCENLALVYFKQMAPQMKVLAGLEPPMQGGGSEWYIPPEELLAGRVVLKPEKKRVLKLLGFDGLSSFGENVRERHYNSMLEEKKEALKESDRMWKNKILASNRKHFEDCSHEQAKWNTERILAAMNEFEHMYRMSTTRIEDIVMQAAIAEIEKIKQETYDKMKKRYEELLQYQAIQLYDKYKEKIDNLKAQLKAQFIADVEQVRTDMGNKIHDITYEKHLAVEKLRYFLQCQNLACQIYVALKEREECQKEIEIAELDHKKKVKDLKEDIAMKNFEIRLEIEQNLKRQEFNRIWKKKICHIVKKFQIFVEYCLKLLPEHAEFFINMEKLMLLQLGEAVENPHADSIIDTESGFHTPVAKPHPFYLFCDKGFKPKLDEKLCPKHCTSSSSQLPVLVLNKRCIYAACDNFEVFTDKVHQYMYGEKGDDDDVADYHEYDLDVPMKYTPSLLVKELKLESSLLQILHQEIPNMRELPLECCVCRIPYCFCSPLQASKMSVHLSPEPSLTVVKRDMGSGTTITRKVEQQLEREPKWDSYMEYVKSKRCKCVKTAKKHLFEHLPAYMRNMSPYGLPELPNYETCNLPTLKQMVKKARGLRSPPPLPEKAESKTREVGTQYSDQEFDLLCNCFSDQNITDLLDVLVNESKVLAGSKIYNPHTIGVQCDIETESYVLKTASSFATERAYSLRNLLDDNPSLEEIFKKPNCSFYK